MGKGACPLSVLNMYWIQLVALQSFASFPHRMDKAFVLLDGIWTSLHALYIAGRNQITLLKNKNYTADCKTL